LYCFPRMRPNFLNWGLERKRRNAGRCVKETLHLYIGRPDPIIAGWKKKMGHVKRKVVDKTISQPKRIEKKFSGKTMCTGFKKKNS